jgi:hypothetical protein
VHPLLSNQDILITSWKNEVTEKNKYPLQHREG